MQISVTTCHGLGYEVMKDKWVPHKYFIRNFNYLQINCPWKYLNIIWFSSVPCLISNLLIIDWHISFNFQRHHTLLEILNKWNFSCWILQMITADYFQFGHCLFTWNAFVSSLHVSFFVFDGKCNIEGCNALENYIGVEWFEIVW